MSNRIPRYPETDPDLKIYSVLVDSGEHRWTFVACTPEEAIQKAKDAMWESPRDAKLLDLNEIPTEDISLSEVLSEAQMGYPDSLSFISKHLNEEIMRSRYLWRPVG